MIASTMVTPFDFVRGYEDLYACRAAAIMRDKAMQPGIDVAALRAEWNLRYPCACSDHDPATACATDLQLAQGLNTLDRLGVLVRATEPAVIVDSAALGRLAGNLAIMERHRRPLPRAQWPESPYVPASLRPLQRALARMHTARPDSRPAHYHSYHSKFWAFYPDGALPQTVAGTER